MSNRRNKSKVSFVINPNTLEAARGNLIVRLGRDLTFKEFCKILDLSYSTMTKIRGGHQNVSSAVAAKIIRNLSQQGVILALDQLLDPAGGLPTPPPPRR